MKTTTCECPPCTVPTTYYHRPHRHQVCLACGKLAPPLSPTVEMTPAELAAAQADYARLRAASDALADDVFGPWPRCEATVACDV